MAASESSIDPPSDDSSRSSPSDAASQHEKPFSIVEVGDVSSGGSVEREDTIVVEEPMEIRVVFDHNGERTMRSLSITMRTPGNDEELAAGFLMTEGILSTAAEIEGFKILGTDGDGQPTGNIVRVDLRPDVKIDFARLQRNFFTTSSCGVCGKASLESLEVQGLQPLTDHSLIVPRDVVHAIPERLRESQPTFARTGGLHAAALCSSDGDIVQVREDVGRHNAVDKLIGRSFLDGQTPLTSYIMMISGRASFEIMQKALVARVPMIVAVGAPSSLAVDMARQYNMTLIGFASAKRFNIYSGVERIQT